MMLNRLWRLKTGSWAEHKSSVTSTAHVTRSSLGSPRLMHMHRFSDVEGSNVSRPKSSKLVNLNLTQTFCIADRRMVSVQFT